MQEEPERTPPPMSNHSVMISRPDPTTSRPTSRPSLRKNTCSHCQSGINTLDKVCSQCGAPNENYDSRVDNNYSCDFYDSSWFK